MIFIVILEKNFSLFELLVTKRNNILTCMVFVAKLLFVGFYTD